MVELAVVVDAAALLAVLTALFPLQQVSHVGLELGPIPSPKEATLAPLAVPHAAVVVEVTVVLGVGLPVADARAEAGHSR